MARTRSKPDPIVRLLRQVEVLLGQDLSMAEAIRRVGIREVTFYRWRKEDAGRNGDQLRRRKDPEKENERLRRAVSDLAWDPQILEEAARGTFRAPRVAAHGSILSVVGSRSRNGVPAGCRGRIARSRVGFRVPVPTRSAGLRTGSGWLAGRSATATAASRPGCAPPAGGSTTRESNAGGGARGGRCLPNHGNGADSGSVTAPVSGSVPSG